MIGIQSYGRTALAALITLLIGATLSSAAEAPAGIVLAVSGMTDPPLSVMTEIPAGQLIRLASGGRLTFLDYARCQLVTVAGGTLTLGLTGYKADGRIEKTVDAPCPRVYAPMESSGAGHTTGGIIMRGGLVPHWPINTAFLLTGARAGKVRAATVYPEDQPATPIRRLDVKGGWAVMPPSVSPLPPNRRYRLRLSFADHSKPVDVTFIGAVPNATASLVVLRLN